jgi:hypothetical protein
VFNALGAVIAVAVIARVERIRAAT